MIELNLTYEESKKILELGYDFSRVCDFAWVSLDEVRRPILACQNSEIQYLLLGKKICDFQAAPMPKKPIEIIPIIPKAALEACLPKIRYSSIWQETLWVGHYLFHVEDLHLLEKFTSPYQAFIWSHENYPEELRKKFEEVMR